MSNKVPVNKRAMSLSTLLDAIVCTYGAVSFNSAIQIIRQHFELEQNDPLLLEEILDVIGVCRFATKKDHFLCHQQIANPSALIAAISKESSETQREYAMIGQSALAAFKSNAMPEYSTHHSEVKRFLNNHCAFDVISAQLALNNALLQMNLDWTPQRIVEHMLSKVDQKSPEMIKSLLRLLSLVYQHTPRWVFKGHTPHELYTPSDSMKKPENFPI